MLPVFRLIIADNDVASCGTVAEYLSGVDDLELVATIRQPEQVMPAVVKLQPDLVLLDFMVPVGQALLLDLQKIDDFRPRCVVHSAESSAAAIAQATEAGAQYYICKPFQTATLVKRLRQILQSPMGSADFNTGSCQEQHLDKARNVLMQTGMPESFKGFAYLREAVVLCLENDAYLSRIMKGLYPAIARRMNTTPQRVERSIRHAIEVTWTHGDLTAIYGLFPYSIDMDRAKPTNSTFIARIVDAVRFDQDLAVDA